MFRVPMQSPERMREQKQSREAGTNAALPSED
jgi:hypothetical protein